MEVDTANHYQTMDWETTLQEFLNRAARKLRLKPPLYSIEHAFPASYRSFVSAQRAGRDLLFLGAAAIRGRDVVDVRRQIDGPDARHEIRIFSMRERPLDELLPILQNLGLRIVDQVQFKIALESERTFIRSFLVESMIESVGGLQASAKQLLPALDLLLSGQAEDDALNRLILLAGLNWREIDLFRTYCNYYLQLGVRLGRNRVYQALLGNVEVARLLHFYFEARFEPNGVAKNSFQLELDTLTSIRLQLIAGLDKVVDVNDDRILRDLFNLIDATLRTNFYFRGDRADHGIAIKIDSLGVINMPSPRPMMEIYVHSRLMEGVHLRGAKVARGGVRWSDRPDDLRGEILDLMQTQMVKNALIVPQGAKGGFVLKRPRVDLDQRESLAKAAYADFIRGLLDLTDNLENSRATHSPELVTYDDADPYLVVAADKGTATWSDHANEIAKSYGFWLRDAFATGGSNGFHHKRLGITARGAWACVKRHFYELARDISEQAFSVVGVGSMDGDVFGNGMLHTNNIRLLAAFSSQHIFIDPNPDSLASFAERRRLFDTPNSTWQDYNPELISMGGGVYRRDDKDISLSAEVRAWLGARHSSIDGEGLIRLLLTASVDLLWMGGVGTYVKASSETNESIADRANYGARVDATQLRAKVVGEGANLAFTQRARVEYALNGGRINTDAVDNSAGVDLSDHEVNLKVLLEASLGGRLNAVDDKDRNQLLNALTDDVCTSVLNDNYRQSLCLSLDSERSLEDIGPFMDLADQLENVGILDRTIHAFPSRKDVLARAGKRLTRPELALLMAYSKLALKRTLLEAASFLQGEWANDLLAGYFPEVVRSRYADHLKDHPLAREIAATMICNKVIDQAGGCFLLCSEGLVPDLLIDAVGLYLAFNQILEGDRWRDAVCALDGKMTTGRQYEYLLQLEGALAHLCRWAIQRGRRLQPRKEEIAEWRAYLREYLDHFSESAEFAILGSAAPETSRQLFLNRLRDFPLLVELSQSAGQDIRVTAELYDEVVTLFGLRQIATLLAEVKARDPWERRLQTALDDRFRAAPARVASMELRMNSREPEAFFRRLGMKSHLVRLQRIRAELVEAAVPTLAAFAAFASELDTLIDACGAGCDARAIA